MCQHDTRDTCHGFGELKVDDKTIFKVTHARSQDARAYSKMTPKPKTKITRRSTKVLNVQGNCCWSFYQRYVLHFLNIFKDSTFLKF